MQSSTRRRRTLYSEITEELRTRILHGDLQNTDRLPPEPALAAELNVSRGTLREAVRALEEESLIARRHGVGSFIRRHTGAIVSGLDRLQSFAEVIRHAGFEPSQEILSCRKVEPGEEVRRHFAEGANQQLLIYEIETRHFADGTPVIYGWVSLPVPDEEHLRSLLRREDWDALMDMLRIGMGYVPDLALLSLEAVAANATVSTRLEVPENTPLLKLEGPTYDEADQALWYTHAFFRTDLMRFVIARRSMGSMTSN